MKVNVPSVMERALAVAMSGVDYLAARSSIITVENCCPLDADRAPKCDVTRFPLGGLVVQQRSSQKGV